MSFKPQLLRSAYLGKKIKTLLEDSGYTITEISSKIGSSRPTVNNILNGRTNGTDSMYEKIMSGIGLSQKQIQEIFKLADREEYKYKYGEDITPEPGGEVPGKLKVALSGSKFDEEDYEKIADFIEMVKKSK